MLPRCAPYPSDLPRAAFPPITLYLRHIQARTPIRHVGATTCTPLPQYSYTGTATDTPLMRWLSDYTFPREAGMQDLEAAGKLYGQLVRRLLSNGTTTALYFASLHVEPCLLLASICEEAGQRAFVGKARCCPPAFVRHRH